MSGDEVVDRVVADAKSRGVKVAHADQREALMLASAFEKRGMVYKVHDWTNPAKVEAVTRLRRWFADGRILLPSGCDRLRRELSRFEERITPSGAFTYQARTGHDDFVALLLTAAMADAEGEISKAPLDGVKVATAGSREAANVGAWMGGGAAGKGMW